jgi:hypothetical protein
MREEMQEVLDYNRDHFKYLLNRDYGVNEPGEPQHIIIKTLNNILWGI